MPAYQINFPELSIPALFLIAISSLLILSGRNWRWLILGLGFQYVGVFLLVFLSWSIGLSSVKLVAGLISAAMLAIGLRTYPSSYQQEENIVPSSRIFRLLITSFVLFAMYALAGYTQVIFSEVGIEILLGCLFLVGSGMLHLGITAQPYRGIIGILTVLSGFEVLYAALENAVLVVGLLAILNLSLGFLGVYLISENLQGDVE